MKLKPLKSRKEDTKLLKWLDGMFEKEIKANSEVGNQIQIALLLIKQYEDNHYAIPLPDPIESIKIEMKELSMKNKDLVGLIGSKGHVSSILNRRKPMTLEIAKIFHKKLGIPSDVLLS